MYEELLCAGRTAHNLHTRNHHPALLQCTSQVEWHLLLAVVVVVVLLLLLAAESSGYASHCRDSGEEWLQSAVSLCWRTPAQLQRHPASKH